MTTEQVLFGINTFLFALLFFFVRNWIGNLQILVKQSEIKLALKLDSITCTERHIGTKENITNLFRHKHAPVRDDGTGGEVIIP